MRGRCEGACRDSQIGRLTRKGEAICLASRIATELPDT